MERESGRARLRVVVVMHQDCVSHADRQRDVAGHRTEPIQLRDDLSVAGIVEVRNFATASTYKSIAHQRQLLPSAPAVRVRVNFGSRAYRIGNSLTTKNRRLRGGG